VPWHPQERRETPGQPSNMAGVKTKRRSANAQSSACHRKTKNEVLPRGQGAGMAKFHRAKAQGPDTME